MEHMDDVASWIRPDEVEPALRLLALLENCGSMTAVEAEAWRQRIVAWASYKAVDGETAPNARRYGFVCGYDGLTTSREQARDLDRKHRM